MCKTNEKRQQFVDKSNDYTRVAELRLKINRIFASLLAHFIFTKINPNCRFSSKYIF